MEVAIGVFLFGSPIGSACVSRWLKSKSRSEAWALEGLEDSGKREDPSLEQGDPTSEDSDSTRDLGISGDSGDSGESDFEVWVETDLDAAWCVEGSETGSWRSRCSTSKLKRKWEEFVALGHSAGPLDSSMSLQDALDKLGLAPENLTMAEARSAFRRKAREQHPDKASESASFLLLTAAFEVVRSTLKESA